MSDIGQHRRRIEIRPKRWHSFTTGKNAGSPRACIFDMLLDNSQLALMNQWTHIGGRFAAIAQPKLCRLLCAKRDEWFVNTAVNIATFD